MTAFELVRDGALLAAELTALLFVPAANAAPPTATLHELHALASAVDVRLLGHHGESQAHGIPDGPPSRRLFPPPGH